MNAPSGFWLLIGSAVIGFIALAVAELRDWQRARPKKEQLEPKVLQAITNTYGTSRNASKSARKR